MAQASPGAVLRYQYQALKAPRSIRALEILFDRPDGRAAIEIAMHPVDLDQMDRRSLHALSYTWKLPDIEPEDDHAAKPWCQTLRCDGKDLKTGASRRFRTLGCG